MSVDQGLPGGGGGGGAGAQVCQQGWGYLQAAPDMPTDQGHG